MELASRAGQSIEMVCHMERMNEYRMAIRDLMADVSGGWVRD